MEACHLPSSQSRMIVERRPALEFERLIEKFWFAPENIACGPMDYEILPDGNFDLLFLLKDSCCRLLFAGPYTRAAFVTMRDDYECFGIRFRPGKMPQIADVSAVDLADTMIAPSRILGIDVDTLGEQLYSFDGVDSKQAFLENIFRKAGLKSISHRGVTLRSVEVVESCGGLIKVNDLANLSGVSTRTMERSFLAEVGISPKAFIRCVRFQNVLSRMKSGKYHSLAGLAYDCGYADQSHFIKDYKELTGRLPKRQLEPFGPAVVHPRDSAFQDEQAP